MKVILVDEIRGLGDRGDVVNVKDGYARNFLFPKKLAREATSGNLKSVEQERKKWAALSNQEKEAAQKTAERMKGIHIRIQKRVGENGHLFGSVTSSEIADALHKQGIEVDKRKIELSHPIKSAGSHEVEVRLHKEVGAPIRVEVTPMGVESIESVAPQQAPAPAPVPAEEESSEV